MIKGLIIFAAGVYTGVYFVQNYNISKVDEPKELLLKAKSWLDEFNKQYKKSDKDWERIRSSKCDVP